MMWFMDKCLIMQAQMGNQHFCGKSADFVFVFHLGLHNQTLIL